MNSKALPYFLITFIYFALPFVNILFALTAIACMTIPFIILHKTKKKIWCKELCPRADYLSRLRPLNIGFKLPKSFNLRKLAKIILYYFGINIFFIIISTVMVTLGRIDPIDRVRLLIAFQLPWKLPQIVSFGTLPAPLIHLSYRFYSLMLTSTLLGTVLAIFFKPRTWCGICPINSISNKLLSAYSKEPIINE